MERLRATVNTNVLFQHLAQDELNDLLAAMRPVTAEPSEDIITQGDEDGELFYCLGRGAVEVWINGDKVSEIPEGGSFGELALIYGTPRAATIRAKIPCELWAIDRDSYRRILMGSVIRKRQMYEDKLEQVNLLQSLDKWERLAVADALEAVDFADGDVVIRQGEEGREFFIIIQGQAAVTQTNDAGQTGPVGILGPGDYFGEIALLTNQPRKATITAQGPLSCAKLDRDRFERVLGPCEVSMPCPPSYPDLVQQSVYRGMCKHDILSALFWQRPVVSVPACFLLLLRVLLFFALTRALVASLGRMRERKKER